MNTAAKKKLTVKGHVVTGNLRRSGFVSQPKRVGRDSVQVTVSFPPIYAWFIENLPDGGYLYEALVEESDRVRRFIAESMKNSIAGFRG